MFGATGQGDCWEIECILPIQNAIILSDALDEYGYVSSVFENEAEQHIWHLKLFIEDEQDIYQAEKVITQKANELDIKPEIKVTKLDDVDWVSETQKKFKPFSVGKFFVHSSYYQDEEIPEAHISIEIDAKQAFGTGEHETTSGCLQALSVLSEMDFAPQRILDMGCGSAILAVAAGKLWPEAELVAVDIEEASVRVAKENFKINHVQNNAVVLQSDGYSAPEIHEHAPYDLILSNILATPLIMLAGALKLHLSDGGKAVLSGLLESQKGEVLHAHREQGLALKEAYQVGDWPTLLLS